MKNEIGGYMSLDANGDRCFYPRYYAFNLARNALAVILRARRVAKIYLPAYMCGCIFDVCDREGVPYTTYPIGMDFRPAALPQLANGEYLYIANYFGILSAQDIAAYRDRYKRVIVDNAQAFFATAVDGVDTIYTCRKFFGVSDGAYLATDLALTQDYPDDRSADRLGPLLTRVEQDAKTGFAAYRKQEEALDNEPIRRMSAVTQRLMACVDYDYAADKRNRNYRYLQKALQPYNRLSLPTPQVPFAYPFWGDSALRAYLIERRIYVPCLWPNVAEGDTGLAGQLAQHVLPLPCDQRYTQEEMQYIIDAVTDFGQADPKA